MTVLENFHACAIELEGTGVLVMGRSGSGKTSLCHGLISHYDGLGKSAVWVSDDQVLLDIKAGCPVAMTPPAIAGKAELHGFGIIDVEHKSETMAGLIVELVPDAEIDRMPEAQSFSFKIGTNVFDLPRIEVPERHESQSVRIVAAKLESLAKIQNRVCDSPALAKMTESVKMKAFQNRSEEARAKTEMKIL